MQIIQKLYKHFDQNMLKLLRDFLKVKKEQKHRQHKNSTDKKIDFAI